MLSTAGSGVAADGVKAPGTSSSALVEYPRACADFGNDLPALIARVPALEDWLFSNGNTSLARRRASWSASWFKEPVFLTVLFAPDTVQNTRNRGNRVEVWRAGQALCDHGEPAELRDQL